MSSKKKFYEKNILKKGLRQAHAIKERSYLNIGINPFYFLKTFMITILFGFQLDSLATTALDSLYSAFLTAKLTIIYFWSNLFST